MDDLSIEQLVTPEIREKDRIKTRGIIGFKRWLRLERQKSIDRLPNEFRCQARDNYDHFNYCG